MADWKMNIEDVAVEEQKWASRLPIPQGVHCVRTDGCAWGMRGKHSGLRIQKAWALATPPAEHCNRIRGRRCDGEHVRQQLAGGLRAALSASYPPAKAR